MFSMRNLVAAGAIGVMASMAAPMVAFAAKADKAAEKCDKDGKVCEKGHDKDCKTDNCKKKPQ